MKSKIFTLSLLTAILLISLISAIDFSVNPASLTFSEIGDSQTITITNANETDDLTLNPDFLINTGSGAVFTLSENPIEINANDSEEITITLTSADSNYLDELDFGDQKIAELELIDSSDNTNTKSIILNFEKPFCSIDNKGDLDISKIEFNTLEGYGDDEDYWYPLDEIEVSFELENKGDWDIKDIEISLCVYDEDKEECIFDEGDFDLSDDDFDLDYDDDEVEIKATLTLDADEFTEGNNNYIVYIGAEGEIDDSDSAYDGELTCISTSEDIEIRTDEEFIIFSDVTFSSEPTPCGEETTLEFKVWNIGDDDLDDDEVFVWVYNKDLNLDEEITFSRGINSMDNEEISISFRVPQDIEEKYYEILIRAYDDDSYNSGDIYENSEEDESEIIVPFQVQGNCVVEENKNAIITAELDSETPEAIAGKQVIIRANIRNTGSDETTYSISVEGNSAWSNLIAIDPQTLTLNSGESQDISIFLNLDEDSAGDHQFTIKATSDEFVKTQIIDLSVSTGVTQDKIINHLKNNWFIYTIILINVILIIAIILVIRRISRPAGL